MVGDRAFLAARRGHLVALAGVPLAATALVLRGAVEGEPYALTSALALAGCTSVEPWVKPYERERIADPVMQVAADPLPAKHTGHVYGVREGARGATGVQGGGCGCN